MRNVKKIKEERNYRQEIQELELIGCAVMLEAGLVTVALLLNCLMFELSPNSLIPPFSVCLIRPLVPLYRLPGSPPSCPSPLHPSSHLYWFYWFQERGRQDEGATNGKIEPREGGVNKVT